jgi:hypothetical protein
MNLFLHIDNLMWFPVERMSYFKRYCLRKEFFRFDETSPDVIDPFVWLAAWIYLIASYVFFVYWIFVWAGRNAGSNLDSWALTFTIGLLQDMFLAESAQLLFVNVIGVLSIRPQLRNIYRVLNNVAARLIGRLLTLSLSI